MSEQNQYKNPRLENLIRYEHINEIFFIVLVLLCFIGDILGELAGHIAVFYWLLMIPVFFSITQLNEKAKELKTGLKISHFNRFNLLYWLSALIAILLILTLWHAESLDAQGAAIAIHIIVAHTMFLLGILIGLRFYLLGLFLFFTAIMTIMMEGIVGMTILLTIPVILLGFYFEKHPLIPSIIKHHIHLDPKDPPL